MMKQLFSLARCRFQHTTSFDSSVAFLEILNAESVALIDMAGNGLCWVV